MNNILPNISKFNYDKKFLGALVKSKDKGDYQRAMPAQNADDVCPLTIELKPLEDGQFLLGCGWCNG